MNTVRKIVSIVLCIMMAATILTACGNGAGQTASTQSAGTQSVGTQSIKEPLLEYSFFQAMDAVNKPWYDDNPKDVVTPYVEEKFNIKVSKVTNNGGMIFKEKFNLLLASNDLPDAIGGLITDSYTLVAGSGQYIATDDLIKQYMPNLMKWINEDGWRDSLINGKLYGIPNVWVDTSQGEYATDLFTSPPGNFTLIAREDILKQCGYSFKSMAEIEQQTYDTQKKPTAADFELTPAIKTPDDLYQLLKKIKALNLKVGDKEVIPFDMMYWCQHHFGSMFGCNSYWRYDPATGEVSHSLGDPASKEFYKFMNKLYKEGLIDKDFMIQKPEQLQEKGASGTVAVGLWFMDIPSVGTALKNLNKEAVLRPVQMPRYEGITYSGIDHWSPSLNCIAINKNFKDIPRLLKYFDWFYSDEGIDICTWGPESAGLWEMKDGKKVFKDPEMYNAYLTGKPAEKMPENFGLGRTSKTDSNPTNTVTGAAPQPSYNAFSIDRSYPFKIPDLYNYFQPILGTENLDKTGRLASGIDDTTNAAATYIWNEFFNKRAASLITAKTDEEFEKEWNIILKDFMEKSKYEEAKKIMTDYFKNQRGLGK